MIIIRDTQETPSVDTRNYPGNVISVRAGQNLKLTLNMSGSPMPKYNWCKGRESNDILKPNERVNVFSDDSKVAYLGISNVWQEDTDCYILNMKSTAGESRVALKVIILDVPGSVRDLKVREVSANYVVLTWIPSSQDGGSAISGYHVYYRTIEQTEWQEYSTTVVRTVLKISNLVNGGEYSFKVCAANRYGAGSAQSTSNVTCQLGYKPPGPTSAPQVVDVTKETATITWSYPIKDGNHQVEGYNVEMKDKNSILWSKANNALLRKREFKITGLTTGLHYEFRVICVNPAGKSKPSPASDAVAARDPVNQAERVTVVAVIRCNTYLVSTSI